MRRLLAVLSLAAVFPGSPLPAQQRAAPSGPLTLIGAIELGRRQGVAAAIARLGVRAAESRVAQRRADLLPTVNGAASVTHQTRNLDELGIPVVRGVSEPFDIYALQLRVSQTLFDGSAIARLRAARDTALAAGLDAQAVGEIAGATAGLAYLTVLSARETVRAREADSAVAAALLDEARQRVAAGISPAIDATRSDVSFASVRTQLEVARNATDRAALDLVRALDLPSGTRLELADSLGPVLSDLPLEPEAAAAYAREHRAEVAAERSRTAAVGRSLRAIRYENLPTLSLNGAYQQTARQLGDLGGSYNLQLLLSVPILDGFRRPSRAREQQARLEIQELRERDATNQVEIEARQAVLDLASARQQVAIAGERLVLAEQELAQAEERFQAGVAGSVETTTAQGSVIAARDALIQARLNNGSARLRVYRALGVLEQLR